MFPSFLEICICLINHSINGQNKAEVPYSKLRSPDEERFIIFPGSPQEIDYPIFHCGMRIGMVCHSGIVDNVIY